MRRCWSGGRLTSSRFPKRADYTLSCIRFATPSFTTDTHLVSEPSPYPCNNGRRSLAADCPLVHSYRFYLPKKATRRLTCPSVAFADKLGRYDFRGFPQFEYLAKVGLYDTPRLASAYYFQKQKDYNCLPKERAFISLAGCFSGLPLNPFLVLNLLLHIFNRIRRFYIKSNGLAGESFDKNLHD
jgi:hypothetical protein